MDLTQKVKWGVYTCKLLSPYVKDTYKIYNESDIAVGEAWLSGEKEFRGKKIKEYRWWVGVEGAGAVGEGEGGVVGGVGAGVGEAGVGIYYKHNLNPITEQQEKEIIRKTIDYGIDLLLEDKDIEEKKKVLRSLNGCKGFSNLDYLEKCNEVLSCPQFQL